MRPLQAMRRKCSSKNSKIFRAGFSLFAARSPHPLKPLIEGYYLWGSGGGIQRGAGQGTDHFGFESLRPVTARSGFRAERILGVFSAILAQFMHFPN